MHTEQQTHVCNLQMNSVIERIQGAIHESSYVGRYVEDVEGVVTGFNGKYGFFIQAVDSPFNACISQGIYISCKNAQVALGDLVQIKGLVEERIGYTTNPFSDKKNQLSNTQVVVSDPTAIQIKAHNRKLPEPVTIGEGGRKVPTQIKEDEDVFNPWMSALDFYESLESMRVRIVQPLVVGATAYEQITIVPNKGKYSANGLSSVGGVVIEEGYEHPERIMLIKGDNSIQPEVQVGDWFDGEIIGILTYNDGNYKVRVQSEWPKKVKHAYSSNPVTTLIMEEDALRIASFNLWNLGGEEPDERFDDIARIIVENLRCPGVIGVQEVQDNNGMKEGDAEATKTYGRLIEAVMNQGGEYYTYTEIAPENNADGGQPNANIRVGILYQPKRVHMVQKAPGTVAEEVEVDVTYHGKAMLSMNPGRIGVEDQAFKNARKPLVAQFVFNKETFFVIVNHFSSKGKDDALFGNEQPPRRPSEAKRTEQAQVVRDFIDDILAQDEDANIIVLGDFNDFQFSETLAIIEGKDLYNMTHDVPLEDRFTYNYKGNLQALDHMLVSKKLKDRTTIEMLHLNSIKGKDQQISDHDPVIISIPMGK